MSYEKLDCEYCGADFDRPHSRGPRPKYCSESHRQQAYRDRRAEAAAADVIADPSTWASIAARLDASTRPPLIDGINAIPKFTLPEAVRSQLSETVRQIQVPNAAIATALASGPQPGALAAKSLAKQVSESLMSVASAAANDALMNPGPWATELAATQAQIAEKSRQNLLSSVSTPHLTELANQLASASTLPAGRAVAASVAPLTTSMALSRLSKTAMQDQISAMSISAGAAFAETIAGMELGKWASLSRDLHEQVAKLTSDISADIDSLMAAPLTTAFESLRAGATQLGVAQMAQAVQAFDRPARSALAGVADNLLESDLLGDAVSMARQMVAPSDVETSGDSADVEAVTIAIALGILLSILIAGSPKAAAESAAVVFKLTLDGIIQVGNSRTVTGLKNSGELFVVLVAAARWAKGQRKKYPEERPD